MRDADAVMLEVGGMEVVSTHTHVEIDLSILMSHTLCRTRITRVNVITVSSVMARN